ncbi:DUF5696 domain-containing protein [Bacillus sp. FJAT-28004]|uniref:DUF5696 domain-containing protein n=1 Tax=Bacillus sp. FJAT-28004 TaxID=1679165 RepID=UPI0006B61315|nr:DUF5696 domain-containing protein [Bacillus sp. FJAT-28004]
MTGKRKLSSILFAALLASVVAAGTIGCSKKEEAGVQTTLGANQAEVVSDQQGDRIIGVGRKATAINTEEELQALSAMELVKENESLQLYLNRETAEVAVKDKRDSYVWFSNPVERSKDQKASPLYQSELSSQVLLTYYNEKGQINAFNSYDDSVLKQQFEIIDMDNGIKVVYRIGNIAKGFANIPKAISKKRFQEQILDQIVDEEARQSVEYKFSFDEAKQIYVVRKLQDYVAEEISATLEAAGYTAEDAEQDNVENGTADAASAARAEFTIPILYTLDNEQLIVSIPGKELQFNAEYPIATVQLLKHFGAADAKESGYLFVPDGAGALIKLNSGKHQAEPYNLPVYGNDGTYNVKEKIQTNEMTRLPVFGMKRSDHALFGVIENGDAMASITADVSGRNDSYNTVGGKFQITAMDFYTLTSGTKTSSVPMFQKKRYEGDLAIRYSFLSGDASDYVGMATEYRNYLVDKFNIKRLSETDDSPFVMELVGAFRVDKSFLGIPYEATETLTSFAEAQSLLQELMDSDIHKIDLRYVGWFNDGIRHSSPSKINVVNKLGGKDGLRELADFAEKNGIGFYPDTAFLEKYKGSGGSATWLDRGDAKVYLYNPVMYDQDTSKFSHYILSPATLPKQINGFMADYKALGLKGLSLRDMGDQVNSDYNPDKTITRQEALEMIKTQTNKLKLQAQSIMVNGGNAYSLPYADVIVNAPTKSSLMNITDQDIPFYQIALHGYYDLAGLPYNMDDKQNPRLSMLKALETGSSLYYQWYASDSTKVKDTDYDNLYALNYKDWLDEAVQLYKEANGVLSKVRNQVIVKHRNIVPGVVETTFQNGYVITINYNNKAVAVEGMQLAAQSYQVGGEADVQ